MQQSDVKRKLTCILAADAVGYSKHMGLDEEGTIRILSAHRAVIDGIIAFHHGRIVSTAGDSVLADFASAVEAVRCAVEIQDALKTRNDSLPEDRQLLFRVGVNLGDVVIKDDDLLGDGVNVAARLETMAEPGGICVSSSVYDQITGKLDLGFHDIGEQNLKNIARPIRVYRVSGAAGLPRARPEPPVTASSASASKAIPFLVGALSVTVIGIVVAWLTGWPRSSSLAIPANQVAPVTSVATVTPAPTPPAVSRDRAPASAGAALSAEPAGIREVAAQPRENQTVAREHMTTKTQSPQDPISKPAAVTQTPLSPNPSQKPVSQDAGNAADSRTVSAAITGEPGALANARQFDGKWNTKIDCLAHTDGALGYSLDLIIQIDGGALRGETGTEGIPGWLQLSGTVQPDGRATLNAKGLTGDPKFNSNRVQRGMPYSYQVAAQFEGARGTGRRLQTRVCNLAFEKQ